MGTIYGDKSENSAGCISVAAGDAHHVRQQEGRQQLTTLWRMLGFGSYKTGLVHGAPYPRSHAHGRSGASRRSWAAVVAVERRTKPSSGLQDNPVHKKGIHAHRKVLSLVDRETGESRSFVIDELRFD